MDDQDQQPPAETAPAPEESDNAPAGSEKPPPDPRPRFARQVSNRVFPTGRRPDGDG